MRRIVFAAAIFLAASDSARAQIAIDSIGGSDLTIEGLVQTDANWYDSDVADLQLGLRYDVLDLNDDAVTGGRIKTITAGMNWYWRSHFKLVLNQVIVNSERAGIDDDPGITEARMQLYW